MTEQAYEEWVESRLDSFAQILPDKSRPWLNMSLKIQHKFFNFTNDCINSYIGNFFINCNLITGETTIFNTKTKRTASAKCHKEDVFDVYTGVAIAWAKYNNETIPK